MTRRDKKSKSSINRTTFLYVAVIAIGVIFTGRLFYLQIIKHEHYKTIALTEHETTYKIPATRGSILARDGDDVAPLVLNEVLPTLFADQRFIEDPDDVATQLKEIIGGNQEKIKESLTGESAYKVIKKKLTRDQAKKIEDLEISGIGLQDESYRVYPENALGAQVLGFVNFDGDGQYGVEEFLNEDLNGQDGILEAITDINNVPLTTNDENVISPAVDGKDITLTIDINIQRIAENALEKGVKASKGKSGSAIVMDPHTGAVLAMANYPTYNPNKIDEVEDYELFQNFTVSSPYEVGSVVKALTMSAGLNEGVVTPDSSYYDAGYVQVDDRIIENAGTVGGVNRTMTNVIEKSVNTGVVHVLAKLGGGESINEQSRKTLYDYFTKKFGFGSNTGIAQANEQPGTIIKWDEAEGNNVRYANMTFGQGMSATMLQMVSALSSVLNGGDYYNPYLVHSVDDNGETIISEPQIIRENVISEEASNNIKNMMTAVVQNGGGIIAKRDGYFIGGKTGTSQVIDPNTGEYSDTLENGSFVGFGGTKNVDYVIMTRVNEPGIPGYAGSVAAAPIFADISNALIDYLRIPPNQ